MTSTSSTCSTSASVLAVVARGAVGVGAFGKLLAGGTEDPDAPSSRARRVMEEKFGGQSNLVLLVSPARLTTDGPGAAPDGGAAGGVDSVEATRAGAELTARLQAEEHLEQVLSY